MVPTNRSHTASKQQISPLRRYAMKSSLVLRSATSYLVFARCAQASAPKGRANQCNWKTESTQESEWRGFPLHAKSSAMDVALAKIGFGRRGSNRCIADRRTRSVPRALLGLVPRFESQYIECLTVDTAVAPTARPRHLCFRCALPCRKGTHVAISRAGK